MKEPSSAESNRRLVAGIRASTLYRTYAHAFQTITRLPLGLQAAHVMDDDIHDEAAPQNRFCELVNRRRGCHGCRRAVVALLRGAGDRVGSCRCFAGLRESAVPVKFGGETVAFLRTGQVFTEPFSAGNRREMVARLEGEGCAREEIEVLQTALDESKSLDPCEYAEVEKLLAVFSLQLSGLINRLVLERDTSEPDVVTRARGYIRDHLFDALSLNDVAEAIGVSSFHFCKIFKQATRMTFTEYVNRKRVECARKALLRPYARVTEVAFEVGYQSLSQFNRSFLRYAGESPSSYRKRMADSSGEAAPLSAE